MHPRCKGSQGSGHRLFLAATILAAKYMYDDTFDNTAWATVSSGLFDLEQVNHMERELLGFLDFSLFIQSQEWIQFYDLLHLSIQNQKTAVQQQYQYQRVQFNSETQVSFKKGWNSTYPPVVYNQEMKSNLV
jgi:hypothetical protein